MADPSNCRSKRGEKCREKGFLTLPRIQIVTKSVSTKTASNLSSQKRLNVGATIPRYHELAEKYFETHKQMTLPGQVLLVDLRPLADVTPQFRAVSKGHTFTPQR
jgi:hypothetical protein